MPQSINYEVVISKIVSNSLKFELVQVFLNQTLAMVHLTLKETVSRVTVTNEVPENANILD